MIRTVMTTGRGMLGLTIIAALLVGLSACGGSGGGGAPEEVVEGMELFRGTCATCHGQDARGMPRLGKDLHDNAMIQDSTVEELVAFFNQGRPANHPENETRVEMPPKGGNPMLTDEDLRLIAVYVRSIQ